MFKILVVEDDFALNNSVCEFLRQNGFQAEGCPNADTAYDMMYECSFDLIISDIMMPVIDGYEFAKTVRGLNELIPILFMTARDDLASKQLGYRAGIDDYMVKPVDLNELLLRVGALLQQPSLPPEKRQEYAKIITEASRRMADLITNILKLNKLENQQIYPEQRVYNLSEQLCECLLAFEAGDLRAADANQKLAGLYCLSSLGLCLDYFPDGGLPFLPFAGAAAGRHHAGAKTAGGFFCAAVFNGYRLPHQSFYRRRTAYQSALHHF